jgi:uncharacterized protein (TIGR02302 family)
MSNELRPDPLMRLDRKVSWQRRFMSFEQLWTAWYKPLLVLGVAAIAVASGLLGALPLWLRVALIVGFAAVLLWSMFSLFKQPRIKKLQVLRKLEASSVVSHRGVSSADDNLAGELADPAVEQIWTEHKQRQLAQLDHVKLVPPVSQWRRFDPYALRVPVALGLVAAFLLGSGSFRQNLVEVVQLTKPVPPIPVTMDAWLKPPAYTGRPPLLLTSALIKEKLAAGEELQVPENSVFTLRVSGTEKATVAFLSPGSEEELKDVTAKLTTKDTSLSAEAVLSRPATIVVKNGRTELGRWTVSLLPDAAPSVELSEKPSPDAKGNLNLKWLVKDDYGVKALTGTLELADEQASGLGFESDGIFRFEEPPLKFALRSGKSKEEKGVSKFDLGKHPWAGLMVTLNMEAKDGAGQVGKLTPVTFKMPERVFVKALPRALIEQRKELALYPDRAVHVGELVDTVNLYPKGLFEGREASIMMGMIGSRLRNAEGYADVNAGMDEMWTLAVKLDEGSLSDLRAELKNLKEELQKALREGAPQERIDELMNKMREAMNKYMDELQKESERRAAEGEEQPQNGKDGKSVSREDLDRMMKELQDMQKNGNSDSAQALLDKLDELLQNLQPGGQQQQAGEGDGGMDDMMQGLGDTMRKQKRLMDDTQRSGPNGEQQGEQGEGDQPGQDGQGGKNGKKPGKGLADRQQELKDRLKGLRGQGGSNQNFEDAERSMGEAEESLRKGDKDGALQKQGEALDKLRKGTQELAEQMKKEGQGRQSKEARDGEGRGGNDDPLGRPRATRNPDTGPEDDMLPNEQAREKAREILETLRKKANEQGLSDQEKSYIDRLMRGLY